MRTLLPFILLGLVACGDKKPAKTPDATETQASTDETPKWDSSVTTGKEPSNAAGSSSGGSSGGVKPNEPAKQRSDQYDKEQTEIALKRAARQVKNNCGTMVDSNGKATGPWGKVTVQVFLGHNGHGNLASIPDPYKGKPTGNCVEQAFSKLIFPPWGGSDTTIDWEVEIVQPEAEKTPPKK